MGKSKKKSQKIGTNLILILIGIIVGLIMGIYLDGVFEEYGFFLSLLFKILIFGVAYYMQTLIHEAGHLVGGLLSGYTFGSFRIGSIMILKEDGKIKFKKQTLAGTGGQCLMTPPDIKDGDLPVMLYNLGGVIMNFLTLPACALLLSRCVGKPVLYAFCVLMFLSGLLSFLINGIPLKTGMVNNDASNARELYKNKEAKIVFYNQFIILEKIRAGVRLRDVPEEYFPMPSEQGMKNSISASSAVFLENRLMDEGRFDEAYTLINKLLYSDSAIIGLHKSLLITDKIMILLMRGELEEAKKLYSNKNYQAFLKQMKNNIAVIGMEYAFALLREKDEKKASAILQHFEKCAKSHPYLVDVESARELISLVDSLYQANKI